ncbi:3'-5' exoribonuclease [Atopostipes suicloacalis DSM 15692]|uniref:3'-5' exoribonuclease n=1 Tax=Atopostipes suicloacalis DSM 15692 TaxID=1121025 RepID=A0A1M4XB69_9LACT|nr:HD domain-containing protein [Atopostipes suicloacalis]SHE90779.1 3'-5' exoribonuclease [Atopostipes suicloacalis DSM 15692]
MEKKLYDYEMDAIVELFLLIKSTAERKTRAGKPFLTITFQDTSGEMTGNLWDVSPEQLEMYTPSAVVHVKGKREEYNGQPQLRIDKIRLADDSEPNNPELYVKRAPLNRETMIEKLNDVIFEITNPSMNRIVRFLLNKYNKEFFHSPAAKSNHHAFNGGLAYHTISMLELAKTIEDYYPNINRSLLYAGLILHDLGKVIELSGPTATEYTLEGQLIGHIVLVDQEITKACEELKIPTDTEDVLLLRHVILAHHGQLEYGSPVRPQVKEAEIIHYLDQIDAKINMMEDDLSKTEPGDFTTKIWALENRRFYKPTITDHHAEDED